MTTRQDRKANRAEEVAAAQRPVKPPGVRYPTLTALVNRNSLTEEVVSNLEALGYPVLADKVKKEIGSISLLPWQKEVLELFERHPRFAEWVRKNDLPDDGEKRISKSEEE